MACAERGQGHSDRARGDLREALWMALETQTFSTLGFGFPATALLLAERREIERAVELYALASRYPFVAHYQRFEDVAGKHISAAAESLPAEATAAAQEWGRARDLWEIEGSC